MSVRNSLISIQDVGIQLDNLATNGNTVLVLSQTQLIGMGTGLNVASASAGGVPFVYITEASSSGATTQSSFRTPPPGPPLALS